MGWPACVIQIDKSAPQAVQKLCRGYSMSILSENLRLRLLTDARAYSDGYMPNFRNRVLVSASILVLSVAAAPAALAQTSATIEEVTVTANRTESLASKTPISLTAVTGKTLLSSGITNPSQLADSIPDVSIDRANGLQITIRGVTSTDGTEKGDPSAAFLLDGIYIARPQAQEVSFFDIDRVEVLRGPQGTLYGRNTTAGVVNVIAVKPKFNTSASADLTVGDFNTIQATGVVNVALTDDLAVRVAGNYDTRDSYVTQGVPQTFSLPKDKDNLSGRATILYKPADNLSLLIRADASRMQGVQNNVPASNFYRLPFQSPAAAARGVDPVYIGQGTSDDLIKPYPDVNNTFTHDSTWGVSAEFNWGFADHWTFTWLGGYRQLNRNDQTSFFIGTPMAGNTAFPSVVVPSTFTGTYAEQSQEVRVAYADERLQVQGGLYYFNEHYGINFLLFGLLNPTPGAVGYVFGFPQKPGGSQSVAAFGQATYALTDQWRITAGLRSTGDIKFRNGATIVHATANDPFNTATDSLNNARIKAQKLTWKVGSDYDLTDSTMAYVTVSTGYKAGGFNDGCAAGTPQCLSPLPLAALNYKPETLTSYEVGVKSKLLDNTLSLNGSYFHYDYSNLQLSQVSNVCGGPCQVTTNAASATVDGVELEGVYLLNEDNRFDFSFTWLDARYADWPIVAGFNFAGTKLDRSPDVTFAGGYTYTMPLGNGATLQANVHTRFSDSYALLSTAMRAQFWQPSFTKTDLSLTYTAEGSAWYVQGYARNVEDSVNVTNIALSPAFPGLNNGTASFGDPRTFGVRLGANFGP